MSMTTFNHIILFMSMRVDQMMMTTNCFKISIDFLIFTTLVCLNILNFYRELALNMRLKLMKDSKNIIFKNWRIKLNKPCMGIHKNNRIAKSTHKGRTPNIIKNQVKRSLSLMTCRTCWTIKNKMFWHTGHLFIWH
jgi:hypothetical protein